MSRRRDRDLDDEVAILTAFADGPARCTDCKHSHTWHGHCDGSCRAAVSNVCPGVCVSPGCKCRAWRRTQADV